MTTDHKPDMIAQAGDLLTAYSKREQIAARFPSDERDANLLLASVLLTVAGELRDVRNIILESATAIAESLGARLAERVCLWRQNGDSKWFSACGYAFVSSIELDACSMRYCPKCGCRISATKDNHL